MIRDQPDRFGIEIRNAQKKYNCGEKSYKNQRQKL
jgi:hypothetical protein